MIQLSKKFDARLEKKGRTAFTSRALLTKDKSFLNPVFFYMSC